MDEFSQILLQSFDAMLTQLQNCKGAHRIDLLLEHVLIIFIGDPRQLPPICRHCRRVRLASRWTLACLTCVANLG